MTAREQVDGPRAIDERSVDGPRSKGGPPQSGSAQDGSAAKDRADWDDSALSALFTERYAELTRLAYVMTGDRELAEDLAQDAFVRAWPKLDTLRSLEAAPAYLRTTLVNLVRQRFRRRMVEWRHRPPLPEPVPAPDDDRSTALDLARLVRTLPPRKRACIALRFYADLSEEETARTLGVSVGTVKSQTHRALRQLAEEMEKAQAAHPEHVAPRRVNR